MINNIHKVTAALIRTALRQHIYRYKNVLQAKNYRYRKDVNCGRGGHRQNNFFEDNPVRSILQLGSFNHLLGNCNHSSQHNDKIIAENLPADNRTNGENNQIVFFKLTRRSDIKLAENNVNRTGQRIVNPQEQNARYRQR